MKAKMGDFELEGTSEEVAEMIVRLKNLTTIPCAPRKIENSKNCQIVVDEADKYSKRSRRKKKIKRVDWKNKIGATLYSVLPRYVSKEDDSKKLYQGARKFLQDYDMYATKRKVLKVVTAMKWIRSRLRKEPIIST